MKKYYYFLILLLCVACEPNSEAGEGAVSRRKPPAQTVAQSTQDQLRKVSVGLTYKGRTFCSGTIITPSKILTAAHCLGFGKEKKLDDIKISFGKDMTKPKASRAIVNIKMHQAYKDLSSEVTPYWDLAIVEFSGSLPKGYKPVKIYNMNYSDLKDKHGFMAGFGIDTNHSWKHSKFKSSKGLMLEIPTGGVKEGLMRVLFEKNGACFGDSGGGLFFENNGELELVGATSGSNTLMNPKVLENMGAIVSNQQNICDLGDTTYTNINIYFDWIAENSGLDLPTNQQDNSVQVNVSTTLNQWCNSVKLSLDEKIFLHRLTQDVHFNLCNPDFETAQVTHQGDLTVSGEMDLDLRVLRELPFFRSITIEDQDIGQFPNLEDHEFLEKLTIRNSKIADSQYIGSAPSLVSLRISNSEVDNTLIANLSEFADLRELFIRKTRIDDIELIARMQDLETLKLRNLDLKDINFMQDLNNLQRLNLAGNLIEDISALQYLGQLSELSLHNNQISDVSPLSNLMGLERLNLFENPVDMNKCDFSDNEFLSCDLL